MSGWLKTAIAGLLLVAGVSYASPEHGSPADPRSGYFYGRATKVADGDTLSVETAEGKKIRVRVAEIDAPERGKPFSRRSRQALNELVWDKDLAIRLYDIDSYGRIVGHVFVDGKDAGRELVRVGLAVVYCRYATDDSLKRLEEEARAKKSGIWSQSDIPDGACDDSTDKPQISLPAGCAGKKFCREMSSCIEALFYLRECGVTSLDGDKDGIPCEAKHCTD